MKPIKEIVTMIGRTRGREPERPFGIHQSDRLHHMYIIGQTGTGKSTLMQSMMRQDIANGQGFCVIDPHGDLASAVAQAAGGKAIYWDAANPDCPYGYNPLTYASEQYRPLIASGLIDTLKKQWADAWGARMEHLLRHALLALLCQQGSSLRDIMAMFLESVFRQRVLSKVTDEQVLNFWRVEFPKMNYKTAADGVAPIANKLGGFLAHPVVRKAVCDPTKPLRFREVMDKGQILVVNLAKGQLGTDVSNLLGGMIVNSLSLAAYSRQALPLPERRPFMIYVDEFHSFTTTAFAEMLSELRKYGVGLILAHQYIGQLEKAVHEAVMGNVGTTVRLRLGEIDAKSMSAAANGDMPNARDLMRLRNRNMYVELMVEGQQSGAFSAMTGNT
jgi:type IV secretory pathway TraG/TraD family ATPase VirD4